ncbi:MAG: hypothetical protein HFI52_06440 [Lachnospiraceae bacterium]|nr:hypothetical protein [Lachnospiraceae bacterium]
MKLDLFNYMGDIYFNDYKSFIERIDNDRNMILEGEPEVLYNEPKKVDIENLQVIPDGRIYSEYKGYRFESFFHRKESKYLYVFLNGALRKTKPQFGR